MITFLANLVKVELRSIEEEYSMNDDKIQEKYVLEIKDSLFVNYKI